MAHMHAINGNSLSFKQAVLGTHVGLVVQAMDVITSFSRTLITDHPSWKSMEEEVDVP